MGQSKFDVFTSPCFPLRRVIKGDVAKKIPPICPPGGTYRGDKKLVTRSDRCLSFLILNIIIVVLVSNSLFPQDNFNDAFSFDDEPSVFEVGGYLKYLQTLQFQEFEERWLTDNLLHHRLNLKWYANDQLTAVVELRNRLFYGESVSSIPGYEDFISRNNDYLDLSTTVVSKSSFFLLSSIDRAYLDFTRGNWEMRIGRQRVNWAKSLVWNPNDIFNAYSFFDFDYEERPGVDAVLLRYNTGLVSSIELVYAAEEEWDDMSLAGLWRFNQARYDLQLMAGKMRQDLVLGAGWSGPVKDLTFRGEASWFSPYQDEDQRSDALLLTGGFAYSFPNTLALQVEGIYNSDGEIPSNALLVLTEPLDARSLTFSELSFLASTSYQISPLITSGASLILNPDDESWYWGFNSGISLSDNIELLLTGQFFGGGGAFEQAGNFLFWRLKWSY